MQPDPTLCPQEIRDSLDLYLQGCPVGGFLTAVLANDLHRAVQIADSVNIRFIPEIVAYVVWKLPLNTYGSYEIVAYHYQQIRKRRKEKHAGENPA